MRYISHYPEKILSSCKKKNDAFVERRCLFDFSLKAGT